MFADCGDYEGSHLFGWFAATLGFPLDLVNFLLSQVFAMAAASMMRGTATPMGASPKMRHYICLILGIACGYFCFGRKAIHLGLLPFICYLMMKTAPERIMANSVLGVAIAYLSCIHLHRQFYLHDSYNLDLTGPLMVITQRVTSLAYCIQDGRNGRHGETKGTEPNRDNGGYEALQKPPSTLEFFSYMLAFQTLLCGPALSFPGYMDFIHGRRPKGQDEDESGRRRAVVVKVCLVIGAAVLHLLLTAWYPMDVLAGNGAPTEWSAPYLLWFCYVATLAVRCKYYLAWLLADIVCNNSGIGYSSPGKWDAVSNVDIFGFETALTFREAVNYWNPGTNAWLREVVYRRVRSAQLVKTYALSAIWHGFYPGYYLTFGTGALFTIAGRKIHRFAQPYAWSGTKVYGALAFMFTRIFMTYATVPFVLLEFTPSFALYKRFYFCLHWVALGALFLPSETKKKSLTNGNAAHHEKNGKLKSS